MDQGEPRFLLVSRIVSVPKFASGADLNNGANFETMTLAGQAGRVMLHCTLGMPRFALAR